MKNKSYCILAHFCLIFNVAAALAYDGYAVQNAPMKQKQEQNRLILKKI